MSREWIAIGSLALTACATPPTAHWVPVRDWMLPGRAVVHSEIDRGTMHRRGSVTSVWVRSAYVDGQWKEAGRPPAKPAAWEYALHDVDCREHTLIIHPRVSLSPASRRPRTEPILLPQKPLPSTFEARLLEAVCPAAVAKRPRPGNRL